MHISAEHGTGTAYPTTQHSIFRVQLNGPGLRRVTEALANARVSDSCCKLASGTSRRAAHARMLMNIRAQAYARTRKSTHTHAQMFC